MKKKKVAVIFIKKCVECKFCQRERVYTGDSFEYVEKYTCTKAKRVIDGDVGVFDKVEIPDWCPILKK